MNAPRGSRQQETIEWLLEEDNPSVRHFALLWLLDRAEDDPEVQTTRESIARSEPVQRILDSQRPQGYWGRDKRPYPGVSNHLLTLEHLGYQGDDERLHRAIDYLLAHGQMEDGAFSCDKYGRGRSEVVPCFTANAVRLLHKCGYGEDVRTERALGYLLRTQLDNGGWLCSERVKKTHACFWATAKVLLAFRALPPQQITAQLLEAQQRAVELFLNSGLYRHHREFGKINTRWFEFARPLSYSTDVLEVLDLVAPYVSADDQRIEEGLEIVFSKRDEFGRWPAERPVGFRQDFPIQFEEPDQPSKWVTLHALAMLKRLH